MLAEFEANPNNIETLLGQQAVEFYRAWNRNEYLLAPPDRMDIIDFDLIDRNFERTFIFPSRHAAITRAKTMRAGIPPASAYSRYFAEGLDSVIMYAEVVEGRKVEFAEYAKTTVGAEVKMNSENDIIAQKSNADALFCKLIGRPTTARDYIRYFTEERLTETQILEQVSSAKERFVPLVAEKLGLLHLLPLEYDEKIVQENSSWTARVFGDRYGIKFEVNTHPVRTLWPKGKPEEVIIHEMAGHVLQTLSWRQNIKDGRINPGYGITSLAHPMQWGSEGMAIILSKLIPAVYAELSPEGKFFTEYQELARLVNNNAHIMVNEGTSVDVVRDYIKRFLPSEINDKRLEDGLNDRKNKHLNRFYLLSHSDGSRYFSRLSGEIGDKIVDLLKALYFVPMTPDGIRAKVAELKAA